MEEIRRERDGRLYACDWTQSADSPLTDEKKAEWAAYRGGLRGVPADNSSVTNFAEVVWPEQPS